MAGSSIQDYGHLGRLGQLSKLGQQSPKPQETGGAEGASFGEALENALRGVDGDINSADKNAVDYVSGKGGDLHNVLIEMERADLQFRTMVQVRNKLVEAYKEVMRMPV